MRKQFLQIPHIPNITLQSKSKNPKPSIQKQNCPNLKYTDFKYNPILYNRTIHNPEFWKVILDNNNKKQHTYQMEVEILGEFSAD